MNDRTVLGNLIGLSVDMNGLIVPGQSIESVLARHAFNLIVVNNDELFKVSLVGSATAIRFRGKEILLATQHQFNDRDEAQIGMMSDSGELAITSGGSRKYRLHPDTDAYDIVALDFSEPCKDRIELKKRFFEFKQPPPDVLSSHVLAILLAGYPSVDQTYEIHEYNHLDIARRHVVCLPDFQPSDDALMSLKCQQPLEVDPDGMSGGSAFMMQLENGYPKAYFAGLILRGSLNSFQILKAGYVYSFMEAALSWDTGT